MKSNRILPALISDSICLVEHPNFRIQDISFDIKRMIEFFDNRLDILKEQGTDLVNLYLDILEIYGYYFSNDISPLLSESIDVFYDFLPYIHLKGIAYLGVDAHLALDLITDNSYPFKIIFCCNDLVVDQMNIKTNINILDKEHLSYTMCVFSLYKYISFYQMEFSNDFRVELQRCISQETGFSESTITKIIKLSNQLYNSTNILD